MSTRRRIALGPEGTRGFLRSAIEAGGGEVVPVAEATALVWADPADRGGLADALAANPGLEWVQLPWAGIEPLVDALDRNRVWTCGKGVYAREVAEHALALTLGGLRNIADYARRTTWGPQIGRSLLGAHVTVLGAGGITGEFVAMLAPFGCEVTVVRRRPVAMAGVAHTVTLAELDEVLPGSDVVVLALALTPETERVLDARRLALLPPHAWVVNVARGRHIDTDALVDALTAGRLGGAALDVTDPEPLPDGHPLWSLPGCVITPHTANTAEMAVPVLTERVRENVRRFIAGEDLLGVVDVDAGY